MWQDYRSLFRRRVGHGRHFGFDRPQAKVLENLLDHFLIVDEADDPYGPPAFATNQRIDIVDLLDKPGPIFSKPLPTIKR